DAVAALNGGYQMAFVVGAVFAALAAVLGLVLLRTGDAAGARAAGEAAAA
ncbi:MAG: MFS transporter, partial [Polaromonas sp.]|nr:MFS transporter [Polaromonas sp.]